MADSLTKTEEPPVAKALRRGLAVFIVLLVLAMFPFTPEPTLDVKTLITAWAAAGLTLLWLTRPGKTPFTRPRIFLYPLAAFLLLMLAAALRSPHTAPALAETLRFAALFLLYLIAAQALRTPRHLAGLLIAACAATALSSLYGFAQRVGLDPFPWDESMRSLEQYTNLPATLGNPNVAAHVLILVLLSAAYLATIPGKAWCLAFLPLFLAHFYLTHQRGGIVALLAAGLLVAIARATHRRIGDKPERAIARTFILFALAAILLTAGAIGLARLNTRASVPLDSSLWLRYNSAQSASRMILERPLLGWGPGAYEIENAPFWTPFEQEWFATTRSFNRHVHCDPLEIAIDAGLPAAAAYLALFVMGIGAALHMAFTGKDALRRRLGYAFAAFFCAFLVDGLFGFNLRMPVSAAFLFLLMGAFEGIASPTAAAPARPSRTPAALLFKGALILLALTCALSETRLFASQFILQRGRDAFYWEAHAEAAGILASGERLAPWDTRFPRERARAAGALGDPAGAAAHYARALEKAPHNPRILIELARATFNLASLGTLPDAESARLLREAARHAEEALELCPVLPEAHELLGRIAYLQAGRIAPEDPAESWREAGQHLTLAAQYASRTDPNVYFMLADTRTELGDLEGAENTLIRAVQADPANEEAWAKFLRFAQSTNRFEALRHELRRQTALIEGIINNQADPQDIETVTALYIRLAQVREFGYADLDFADRAYRAAARRLPHRPHVWGHFAAFAKRNDRQASFLGCFVKTAIIGHMPNRSPSPPVEAAVIALGDGPRTLEEGARILLEAPTSPGEPPALELGWAADLIAQELDKPGPEGEDQSPARATLARVYARIGAFEEAHALFTASFPRLSPAQQSEAWPAWHETLLESRDYAAARELVETLATRSPDDPNLKLAGARTLARSGQRALARLEYTALLNVYSFNEKDRALIEAELQELSTDPPQKPH